MGSSFEEVNKLTESVMQLGKRHRVILFNDDAHSMDQVAIQVVRAINCSPERAWEIMLAAHTHGRAEVIVAHQERCEHVAQVLREIQLATEIEPV